MYNFCLADPASSDHDLDAQCQWRGANLVGAVHLGAVLQQQAHHGTVALLA